MGNDREDFRARALSEAGIAYSLSAVLPVLFSVLLLVIAGAVAGEDYADTDWYRYLGYLLPQLCFAAASVVFFRRSKISVKSAYRGCKWQYFLLAVLLQFGLLFSLSELNEFFIGFLERFGYTRQSSTLPSLEGWNLLPAILVIALLPALFEETIFRGILSRQMHENGWGLWITVFVSGALFSLFHHNPEQTLYQLVCGVCFTLVALRSGSVFPTMVAHFLNNAAILALTSTGYETVWTMPKGVYLGICIASAVCLIGTVFYLAFFDKRHAQKGKTPNGKAFLLAAAIGIAVCALEWVLYLVTGFVSAGGEAALAWAVAVW